jgi:ribosome-associated protein YbcJ (S4-like RNA binding protein)
VPLQYKGVALQPAQIKNLLLGNAIEVTGLRDERRAGLYRATVQFNVLHNKAEESTKREELRTENKAEFVRHQQAVHQRGSDQVRSTKDSATDNERRANDQQPPKQRPAFRAGR